RAGGRRAKGADVQVRGVDGDAVDVGDCEVAVQTAPGLCVHVVAVDTAVGAEQQITVAIHGNGMRLTVGPVVGAVGRNVLPGASGVGRPLHHGRIEGRALCRAGGVHGAGHGR